MNTNVVKEIRLIAELPPAELFKEISYWEAYEKHIPLWNLMSNVNGQSQNNMLYPGMRMICADKKSKVQGYLLGFDNRAEQPMVFIIPAQNPTLDQFPHAEWMDSKPWHNHKDSIKTIPSSPTPYIRKMLVFLADAVGAGITPAPIMPDLHKIPDPVQSATIIPQIPPVYEPINTATPATMSVPANIGAIPKQILGQLEDHINKLSGDQKLSVGEIITKLIDTKFNNVDAVCEFGMRKLKKMPKTLEVEEIRQFYYRLGLYLLKDNSTDAIKYLLEDEKEK